MTFWDKLQKYPPVLIRLVAKNDDGSAMTDGDICVTSRGSLGLAEVRRLSVMTHWHGVDLDQAHYFMLATGCDLENPAVIRHLNRYVKDAKFQHLRRHRDWPQFKELLRIYLESQLTR